MINTIANHHSLPCTPTAMSILINSLPHPTSILFKPTLNKHNKPQLHSISVSAATTIRKFSVCLSSKKPNSEPSEPDPVTKFSGPDPPSEEADDEWGGVGVKDDDGSGNGTPAESESEKKLRDLKRAFVDTVHGTDFGFRASSEVRAEAVELIGQLEAANPTPAPTETPELFDGNWNLVFTTFSELLPLLAAGNLPFVKVEKICQSIDSSSLTIENSTTLSSPVATLSFSASAAFEVRTPTRIEVQFKEGSLKPPEIKSNIDLPENVDIFGQTISLSPVQQSLDPLQDVVAGIARAISGQPSVKIPIPGERAESWLLVTYLDKDFRISRGDGSLFVLAKEGSPFLDQ